MPPTIKDRAAKCLYPLPAFKPVADAAGMQLAPDEALLGLYSPIGSPPGECLVITDRGVHWICPEKRHFIEYAQIERIDSHHNKQDLGAQPDLRTLNIQLQSGDVIELPVRGRRDRYLDMFAVWRFLNYVLADIKRDAEKAAGRGSKQKRQTA